LQLAVAGALFGIEVLVVGQLMYDVLLPSFIAGITAYEVSSNLGISYFYSSLNFSPVFSEFFFVKVLLSGLFFGIISFIMIETFRVIKFIFIKAKQAWWLNALISGILVAIPALFLGTKYLGLGLNSIESVLNGGQAAWYDPLLKIIFTSIPWGAGGSGGVITPIFFVGTTAGSLFSAIAGVDPSTFAAIGMVALLAGAANTPIAASIMSIELFGPKLAPYAAVSCIISYLMTGHRSIYPSQLLGISKSRSLETEVGKEISAIKTSSSKLVSIMEGIKIKIISVFKNTKRDK
jgi:H+/Cl- antiporter ClcA